MKGSGIVRRLDELGRIVIPKELRRSLRIKDGDELEITSNGDVLTLRKYSGIEAMSGAARSVAKMLAAATGADVLFLDSAKVQIADGPGKGRYQNARLCDKFSEAVAARRTVVLHGDDVKELFENIDCLCNYVCLEPILVAGDFQGALALVLDTMPSDLARAYLHFTVELFQAVLA